MDLEDLKAKIEDIKSLKKEDLEKMLQDMRERFEEKTGLDLDMVVKSYKTALAGTREEKIELRAEVLDKGTETEYWLGHGMTYGDRTVLSAMLEAIGMKVPSVKYAARVLESYVVTDALLCAVDRSVGGFIREGVDKVKDKVEQVKSERAARVSKKEEGLVDWLKDEYSPVKEDELELPDEEERENPYF